MLDRRALFAIGALGLGFCTCRGCFAAPQESGCIHFESGGQVDVPAERARFAGLKRFDFTQEYQNALVHVFADVSSLLSIDISFGSYDDPSDAPNAGATKAALVANARGADPSDGTIAIGNQLVAQTQRLSPVNLGPALSAVIAHEAGHILQFKYLMDDFDKLDHATLLAELHADFVCGYYAAFRKAKDGTYPAAIQAMTQFRFGDKGLVLVQHGSPEQRGRAVYEGFQTAQGGTLEPERLARRGLDYVRTVIDD